jgi:hypothetical protein
MLVIAGLLVAVGIVVAACVLGGSIRDGAYHIACGLRENARLLSRSQKEAAENLGASIEEAFSEGEPQRPIGFDRYSEN